MVRRVPQNGPMPPVAPSAPRPVQGSVPPPARASSQAVAS